MFVSFWVGNEELVNMYEEKLGDAGYHLFKLPQTNNRGDGKCVKMPFIPNPHPRLNICFPNCCTYLFSSG